MLEYAPDALSLVTRGTIRGAYAARIEGVLLPPSDADSCSLQITWATMHILYMKIPSKMSQANTRGKDGVDVSVRQSGRRSH